MSLRAEPEAGAGRLRPARLPDFPWDHLAKYKARANEHPDGIVDASVGTPVDPTPEVVQAALRAAADAPGYPETAGTPGLRAAAADWLSRRLGVSVPETAVLPTVGSKEVVAGLPSQLGVQPGARVVIPTLAYPTYEIGALLAGAVPAYADEPPADADGVGMVWLNSPANPTGRVMSAPELRAWVEWGRANEVVIVSDECYIELGWTTRPTSMLHPDICGGSHDGLLAVHSLSKRSNLAGYRGGIITGDPRLVRQLLQLRRHAGLIVPWPVQQAMTAAYADDTHAGEQRARYESRRARLAPAFTAAGLSWTYSDAGLYFWLTRGEDCWETVAALAELGISAAPGTFYGDTGGQHVRFALTITDERTDQAVARLATLS